MKFISVKSVVEAYKGFQDCMTNKSWGYLALLKGCKSSICPSVPYEVNLDEVSSFLENIFNLSQAKKRYSSGRVLYVNPEKPDVPLNKNDAFQKVQKRRVQEKR